SKLYFKIKKQISGSCDNINWDDDPLTQGAQEGFDDDLFFCCDEANSKTVPIIFRVYEINPGTGPVNPARELPGGDLYGHFNESVIEVEVQDKLAPVINCPKDTVIDCAADYSNLSRFGNPGVKDNCGFTLDSTITRNINECGTGTILRTFRARDAFGNEASCTQTITIINKNPLKAEDIDWPEPYITEFCNAKVNPTDLPAGFDKPKVEKRACNLIAVAYTDQVFDIAQPACYKILRTWEVIDWCVYEPSRPDRGGKFSYVQVIRVEDRQAPVLTCPGDVLVPTSNNCGAVPITVASVTATDCNTAVTITNDSPYATAKGANASGTYPPGIHTVTFTATDGCGNTSTCKIKITVEDRTPPGAICIVGLSTNLTNTDGQIKAIVKARQFNGGSSDNCTPASRLKYTLRRAGDTRPPIDTQLVFTCEDIGSQLVEFWVTDEKGNSSQCVTFIAVQDNNQICPAPAVGRVAGGIETERGDLVEGVNIKVNNSSALQAFTGHNGFFEFPNLPIGKDYTIVPDKDGDLMNGVTTLDIVLISKHILGIQRLDTPYKLIAADVDRSGAISAIDLIRLRKILLGIERTLPNNNRSWRFVDAKYKFANPENPFQREFPEIYNINDFDGKPMEVDFVAIKVGDVNGSAKANDAANVETRAASRTLTLTTSERAVQSGETFTIDINPNIAAKFIGYQFAMRFDPELLEFISVENGDLPDLSETNIKTVDASAGILLTSWNTAQPVAVSNETVLFSLTFRAKAAGQLSKMLQIEPRALSPEAYETETEVLKIALQFRESANVNTAEPTNNQPIEGKFELYQNAPNPFATQTVVSFRLPKTSVAKLIVFDANGRTVYNKEGTFNEGYNEIVITRDEVQGEGMLYYRLETQEGKNATRKMMLLD
ncbi:MAG: cohesin domain-containing protein, partial [Saprospiraceae bacterium]